MEFNAPHLYQRFLARDPAYEGRVIVGVKSTGIYCRFTCPARKPKFENVKFYHNTTEACAGGLRPCLRCFPDRLAVDDEGELVAGIAARLPTRLAEVRDVSALADLAGIGASTLTRLFRRRLGVTPAAFLTRIRVEAAARALKETERPILDIAYAVGFASASTFHARFRAQTGFSPATYREAARGVST